jgi:hypothetical protein
VLKSDFGPFQILGPIFMKFRLRFILSCGYTEKRDFVLSGGPDILYMYGFVKISLFLGHVLEGIFVIFGAVFGALF